MKAGGLTLSRTAWQLRRLMSDRRLRFGLLLLGAVLALLWTGIGVHLAEVRRQAERATQQDADNLTRSLEQSIVRTVEAADQMLRFMQVIYARDPAGFDLFDWANAWPPADGLSVQMALIGADGWMRASSMERTTTPVDLSDREHFRVHQQGADGLFISKPVLGRVSRRWTIQFTRPMRDAAGRFDGVLVLSMDTAYLSRFYDSLRIGQDSVALVGEDGVVRARAPFLANALGERLPAAVMARLDGRAQGSYRAVDGFDGVERLYSFRSVANYPLVVLVGLDVDEAFAAWQLDRHRALLAGGLVSLMLTFVAVLLLRQYRTIAHSQKALAVTLERMTQGVVMAAADGRVLVLNQQAKELLELPPRLARAGANIVDMLRLLGPPAPGNRGAGLRERRRADDIVVESQVLPLADGGTLLTCTDVTAQRVMAEAQEAARAAAEAASRAKSDFLANMSHEIRTPMNGVLGMIQLLRHSPLEDRQRQWCETMTRSADGLLRVVNDILDYSKLEAGRILLEPLSCYVPGLVAEVVDLLRAGAEAKRLALRVELHRAPPPLLLDPTRLRQIVLNLLSNAVKFSERGEITVTVDSTPAANGCEQLRIGVRDHGIGMPAAALATLFSRFTQADASSTRRFGGSGLGLAISQELARLMGGAITVRSTPGEGSEFTLSLLIPVATTPPVPTQLLTLPEGSLQPLTILVAEDDEVNRLVIGAFLQPAGHRVSFAHNGAEALAAVQDQPFDLVLMDVMMPGMDGPTATTRIRALAGPVAQVPIIALTANAMAGDREAYLAGGMDGYVSKPINRHQLQAEIARVLGLAIPVAVDAIAEPPAEEVPEDLAAEMDDILAGLKD